MLSELRVISATVVLLVLAGCSSLSVKEVMGPDGKKNYSITCEEPVESCYEAAAKQCPNGYSINNNTAAGIVDRGAWGKSQKINLLISCK